MLVKEGRPPHPTYSDDANPSIRLLHHSLFEYQIFPFLLLRRQSAYDRQSASFFTAERNFLH